MTEETLPRRHVRLTEEQLNNIQGTYRCKLLVKKLDADAIIPTKKYSSDAGFDIYAFESMIIPPWERRAVLTKISFTVPEGTYGRIAPRSGLSIRECKADKTIGGIDIGAGVIDEGYRGEVKIIMINNSNEEYTVKRGDRIAQLILERHACDAEIHEVSNLDQIAGQSDRGTKGFGSSGK